MSSCNSSDAVHWRTLCSTTSIICSSAEMRVARDQIEQALLAEHFAVLVFRLGDAVGEAHQQIAAASDRRGSRRMRENGNAPTTVPFTSSRVRNALAHQQRRQDARRWCR